MNLEPRESNDLLPGTSIDDLVADLLVLEDMGETDFLDSLAEEVAAHLRYCREGET